MHSNARFLILTLGISLAVPICGSAQDTIRKAAPVKKHLPKSKSAASRLADTALTAAAGVGVQSILGKKAGGVGSLLGAGAMSPCGAGGASAGAAVVGLAKGIAKKTADSTSGGPCSADQSAASMAGVAAGMGAGMGNPMAGMAGGMGMMKATPVGMAITVAPTAAKALGHLFGGKGQDKAAMVRDLGKGRLELKDVKFVEGADQLQPGYEPSVAALGEAIAVAEGSYVLYVAAEAANKGEAPDTAMAHKRLATIQAALAAGGVVDKRVIAMAELPNGMNEGRKPPKPGKARVELLRLPEQEAGSPGAVTVAAAAAATGPSKVWVNYDFVPGRRTIFFADYADDKVGNFPLRLKFTSGNMEVAEVDGKRYLRATSTSTFVIPLPEILPLKYTIEIDVINRKQLDGSAFRLQGTVLYANDGKASTLSWGTDGVGMLGGGADVPLQNNEPNRLRYRGKAGQFRVMGDGEYIKAYLDEKRFVNVPNAKFARSRGLNIQVDARGEENPVYIGQIRIAASDRTIYDEIAAKGRVATQGIRFDTGSDKIQPESTPTLKEIGAMMQAHPEMKLTVEGHTDNVGAAPENLKLSQARAAAVAAALVADYGVDTARLTPKGFGSTRPLAPNKTPEARQNNRRVELVKI